MFYYLKDNSNISNEQLFKTYVNTNAPYHASSVYIEHKTKRTNRFAEYILCVEADATIHIFRREGYSIKHCLIPSKKVKKISITYSWFHVSVYTYFFIIFSIFVFRTFLNVYGLTVPPLYHGIFILTSILFSLIIQQILFYHRTITIQTTDSTTYRYCYPQTYFFLSRPFFLAEKKLEWFIQKLHL